MPLPRRSVEKKRGGKRSNDRPKVSAEDYEELSAELFKNGHWCKLPTSLIPHISAPEILMLSSLINWSSIVQKLQCGKPWDGWFYCRLSQIRKELGFRNNKQCRILKLLRKRKFIDHELRNLPAQRHFRINFQAILDFIERKKSVEEMDMTDVPFDEDE